MISLSPQVYSAIVVGTSAHSLAEGRQDLFEGKTSDDCFLERTIYPIGPRSFTFPASIMQPFKAQLDEQPSTSSKHYFPALSFDLVFLFRRYFLTRTKVRFILSASLLSNYSPSDLFSSSLYHSTFPSDPRQTLLLSYGIVTFDNNSSPYTQIEYVSDGHINECRLNSDVSLMSIAQPKPLVAKRSLDNILSSSTSSSHIFRTISVSTSNVCDNLSGRIRNSNASIIVYEENFPEQMTMTTTYLLDPPSSPMIDEIRSNSIPSSQQSNAQSDDAYAMHEPLTVQISSFSSPSMHSIEPISPTEKSVHYTDILFTHDTGDEPEEYSSSSLNPVNEEKSDPSTTFFYANIDYQQTQRRHRLAQYAELSKLNDQLPPFVL